MRFGLSDLEELPSLKEFEQLAQAALGNDDGIAPIEPEDRAREAQSGSEGQPTPEKTAETPKVAAAAAGATTSSATPVAETLGPETSSTTDSSLPESSTESGTPETESAEEMISGADGD
jgi:hypothetical protein